MFVPVLLCFQIAVMAGKAKPKGYVGARICAECHPQEYATQSKSSHARALHRGQEAGAFSFLPEKSVHETADPDSASFEFRKAAGRLSVAASLKQKLLEIPVDWIMGSGAQGLTFFSQLRAGEYLEHRFSYYSRIRDYDITTGQSSQPAASLEQAIGLHLTSGSAFQCLNCHATSVTQNASGPDFDSVVPGVTCERCHGPGGAHVTAVKANAPDRRIRDLRKLSGDDLVMFCGECHRTDPPPGVNFEDPIAARFQPVGLQMSACFQKSNGALNCVTCHSPHDDARRGDVAFYDRQCLSCHSTRATVRCKSQSSGCTSCHMPRVTPVPHLSFADHWIRVHNRTGAPHS